MGSNSISVEQRFALLAAMGANIDWSSLTTDQVQAGIKDPQRMGREVTLFIQSGFRVQIGEYFRETGEISIQLPALKRPTLADLQAKYGIKEVERDTSTEAAATMTFATVLVPGDGNSIGGEEYERRIVLKHNSLLGYQHREYILEHQDEFPELALFLGKIYIDFPGIVVVNLDGSRSVPYCYQYGSRWYGHWDWLSSSFDADGRIAVGK